MFRNARSASLDLDALFNASPNAYVLFDPGLVIVGCNEAYLRVVGRASRDEIVGRYLFDAFPSDPETPSYKLLKASLDRVIETEESDHIALIPYDTSGPGQPPQMRYWSATHTPVFDADGRFHLILQHTEDVTELQRLRSATRRDNMSESSVLRRAAEVQAANSLLASEVDLVRSLFRQAPGFMALLAGPDHVFQLANAAYEDLVGRHDLIGLRLAEALPEVVGQGFVELLDQVMRTGEPFIGRGVLVQLAPTPGDPPVDHFLDFIYQPYRDASGEVVGVFVQGHDITEQKKAEQDVFRQTEILRLAQEAGGFGTFEWDLATGLLTASPAFRRLYGFDGVEEIPVRAFQERVHPDDAAKLATSPGQTLEEALQYAEYRVRQPSGDYIWVGRQGTVLNDAQGRPSRVVGAVHDITRRKQFEAQLETLARESTHRVKNLLAIVQAIVSQTLRKASDIDSASLAIRQRLMAIAATQTALTNGTVAESDLDTLVRSALELHTQTPGRVRIAGPNVVIDGKTALGLTLVLHELGTNAVKYGALSREGGHVDIAWTIEAGGRHADLSWRESGGPRVTAPARQGFGSHLIARSLPPVDGVEATIDYAPTGLVFRVRLAVGGAEEGSPPAQ